MPEWALMAVSPVTGQLLAAAEVFIIGSLIGAIVLVILYGRYREKKRTRELEAVAREQGFAFSPVPESGLLDELYGFQLFTRGHSRSIRNVLSGAVQDVDYLIFDYRYTTGSGKNATTHYQTVAVIRRPGRDLPNFYLRPESIFSKIGKVFGFDDINFESHPVFSRQYNLSSPSAAAVRALFTEDMLTFFESNPNLCAESDGQRLLLYRPGKRLPPSQIPDLYALAWSLHELLPGTGRVPEAGSHASSGS